MKLRKYLSNRLVKTEYVRRGLSALLCICMMLSMAPFIASEVHAETESEPREAKPEGAIAPEEIEDLDQALHFLVRHWHTEEDSNARYQGGSLVQSGDRYFVIAEGYIVPVYGESQKAEDDKSGNNDSQASEEPQQSEEPLESEEPGYEGDGSSAVSYNALQDDRTPICFDFYVRFQNSDWLYKMEPGRFESDYLESLDPVNGVLILKANPVKAADGDGYSETFSGFSVSAGRGAVSYGSSNGNSTLIITYNRYVHLVRANAFYVGLAVNGTSDSAVFGTTGIAGDEHDTVFLYVYQEAGGESMVIIDGKEVVVPAHKANEIVKLTVNGAEKVYQEGDILPDGLKALVKPEPVKFYSTVEGLHTDKTAYDVAGDGRTFDVELESWYTEGYAPQIGMVLDASGSMVFASDIPEPIRLTAEEIAAYGIKQLVDGGDSIDWNDYFLNNNPNFNKILNPRYTDNTSLGATSYNYFVYDGTDYSPLGYWEGVDTEVDKVFHNSKDTLLGSGAGSNGFHIAGKGASAEGIVLDAKPTSDSFTISFLMRISGGTDPSSADDRKTAQLMYIGPLDGIEEQSGYYRLVRDEGSSSNRLKGNQNMERSDWLTNFNSVFNGDKNVRVTLVFNDASKSGGTVTAYLDGDPSGNEAIPNGGEKGDPVPLKTPISVDDIHIIINGIQDAYDDTGARNIYMDDIYVIDRALTSESDVKSIGPNTSGLIGHYEFEPGADALKNSASGSGSYATKLEKQAVLTASTATAPTVAKTRNGTILGSVNRPNSDATQAAEFTHTQAGWYFITHAGQYENHYKLLGTGKRLIGLNGTQTSSDNGKEVRGIVDLEDKVKVPSGGLPNGDQPKNTGYTYTNQTTDTPTLFYVDADGYLRCFYSRSSNLEAACSYVYFLDDSQNVRVSAMQRALGLFVTELKDRSPSSRVSAVRFSTNDKTIDNKLDELVVLDWTNDTTISSGMMSLTYGDGSATASETNTGRTVKQYNYGLTGSTSTAAGIRAYIQNLQSDDHTHDMQPKYLIIFTDGQDTDVNFGSITGDHTSSQYENAVKNLAQESEAYKLVNQLKEDGYTIFTILLYGDDTSREYTNAHIFLRELAGTKNTTDTDDKEQYFYSVPKAREKAGSASASLDDSDVLTQIFVDDVLSQITNNLNEYRIRDYIDPRFDLIGSVAERYGSAAGTENSDPADTDEPVVTEEPSEPDATTSATRIVPATDTYLFHLKNNGVVILKGLDKETGKETGAKYAEFNLLTGDYKPKSGDADYHDYEPIFGSDGERLDLGSMLGEGNDGKRYLVIHSDKGGSGAAKNFCLCYDPVNAMYYLEWRGETIPGSTFDAEQLNVWHATFTLRAKEDFVGGNAVLTNGQLTKMNYVFPKGEEAEASSGTDKATGENPSKGFPRVTVNVKIPSSTIQGFEWTLWLGEDINPEQLIQDLAETSTESNFWMEYPRRFALAGTEMQETLYDKADISLEKRQVYGDKEAIIKALLEGGGTIEIPYAFLPETPSTQAGNQLAQQIDVLGVLSYSWERIDPDTGRVIEDADIKDRYETGTGPLRSDSYMIYDTRKVMYRLAVEYKPFPDPNSEVGKTLTANKGILENIKNVYVTQMMAALTELEHLLVGENLTREMLNEPLEKFESALESLRIDLVSLEFDSAVWGSEYEILAALRDKLESLNVEDNNERSEARAKAEECEEQLEYFDHLAEYALWCGEDLRTEARTKQNDTLIKDEDYSTPKPAVGSPQYNVTLAGEHTTRIVRGELAFELALNLDELDYMFDNDWNAKAETGVTYTVKVEAKDVADDWKSVIPTELTVTITKVDLDALKALADADKAEGADTVTLYYENSKYPKAAYDIGTGEITFYTDPRIFNEGSSNGYAHLLPKGAYTLTPDDDKNSDWEKFNLDRFTYAPLEDYTRDKGHFTDNPADYDDVNSLYSVYAPEIEEVIDATTGASRLNTNSHYYAKTAEENSEMDSVTFLLGTYPYDPVPDISKVEGGATMSDLRYLTERVGMVKVSATLENGLPDTQPEPSESPRVDPTPIPSVDPTPTPSDDSIPTPVPSDSLLGSITPADDPDEPGLPQTGQLWWPAPLLLVGGLALFVVGMLLMRPKYKADKLDEDGADSE